MIKNKVVQRIKNAISGTEFEGKSYIAGGFVRDYIMNKKSKDIDIVVELPNGGIRLAEFLYNKLNTPKPVIFKKFGTVKVLINNIEVEFVMSRMEKYNPKSRNPEVIFTTINNDVIRRDFTINTILYDISNDQIIDLVNGVEDIKNKIIRATSSANSIFMEDPLRIMRAIRFAAQLDFDLENITYKYIIEYVDRLQYISNERIRDEFNKILISKNPIKGLILLKETGILEYMIPEFKRLYDIKNQGEYYLKDAWNHTLEVVKNSNNTIEHRLSALLHDVGKGGTMLNENGKIHFYKHQFVSQRIASRFLKKYKYTNQQIEWITNAISFHMNFIDGMLDKTIRKMVYKYGKDQFLFFTDLGLADSKRKKRINIFEYIINFVKNDKYMPVVETKLPINGNMIMNHYKLNPSKLIGDMINIEKEYLFEHPNATNNEIFKVLDDYYVLQFKTKNILNKV